MAEILAQHLNGQEGAQVEHEHVDEGFLHEFVNAVVIEVVKQRFFVVQLTESKGHDVGVPSEHVVLIALGGWAYLHLCLVFVRG